MNVDVSEGDCDAGSLSPWMPARTDGGSAEARLGRLKAEIEVLLAAFCEKELQVDATDCAMSEESELFSISRPVAGLSAPVECVVRDAELAVLCDALFGARSLIVQDGPASARGPLARHVVMRVLERLIDKFCEAASSTSGQEIAREVEASLTPAKMQSASSLPDGARTSIRVDGRAVRVEFLLATDDVSLLIATTNDEGSQGAVARDRDLQLRLESNVASADIRLSAIFDDRAVTPAEIRTWRPGSVVDLQSTPQTTATLTGNGRSLFRCEIARDAEFFVLHLLGDDSDAHG